MSTPTPAVGSGKISAYESAAQHPIQAISWGASSDIAYPAAGTTAATGGPYNALLLQLGFNSLGTGVRVGVGATAAAAVANCAGVGNSPPGTWLPGSTIAFLAIPYGSYLAVVSNDTNSGNFNVTLAL